MSFWKCDSVTDQDDAKVTVSKLPILHAASRRFLEISDNGQLMQNGARFHHGPSQKKEHEGLSQAQVEVVAERGLMAIAANAVGL